MTPKICSSIDRSWQKLQTSAIMHSQLLVKSGSLAFCLLEINIHCLQSEENVLSLQIGFRSYFLEQQDMLNHYPETSIAVDAV